MGTGRSTGSGKPHRPVSDQGPGRALNDERITAIAHARSALTVAPGSPGFAP
jgi:hypothetical protein